MPQAFFQAKQHRLFVASLDIDDAVGMKARAGKRRGKKIARPQAPQHQAFETREDSRRKKDGGCAMHRAWPAARDLMQAAKHKPALRQARIDFLNAERQGGMRRAGALLQMRDPGAQIVQNRFLPRVPHGFWGHLFSLCSLLAARVNEKGVKSQ